MLLLDGSVGLGAPWAELRRAPDLTILLDAVANLRCLDREEEIALVYFDGVRTANIFKATASEASVMARCTGKANLQNVEPEDLWALTVATATGIPLAGTN